MKFGLSKRLDVFLDARKAWYTTRASGLLPLDATYTSFADVKADAQLDPFHHPGRPEHALRRRGVTTMRRSAHAQAGDFIVKLGVTSLSQADKIDLMVGGAPFPGAGLSTFAHQTVSAQFAYFFTDTIAFNATLGFPPTIKIFGAGSIGALPMLGKTTYGPTAFTLQWHPIKTGRFRPYVGAGASYMIVSIRRTARSRTSTSTTTSRQRSRWASTCPSTTAPACSSTPRKRFCGRARPAPSWACPWSARPGSTPGR